MDCRREGNALQPSACESWTSCFGVLSGEFSRAPNFSRCEPENGVRWANERNTQLPHSQRSGPTHALAHGTLTRSVPVNTSLYQSVSRPSSRSAAARHGGGAVRQMNAAWSLANQPRLTYLPSGRDGSS